MNKLPHAGCGPRCVLVDELESQLKSCGDSVTARTRELAKAQKRMRELEYACEGSDLYTENARLRAQVKRLTESAVAHQDDCDRVQDISGRAPCNCAEIGRMLRRRVKELEATQRTLAQERDAALKQARELGAAVAVGSSTP